MSADATPTPPGDGIARNTVFALLVQATTTVFTAITTLVLVRALGPDEFGVFALALGIAGVVGIIARFGMPGSLARFMAENPDDPAACATLLRDALRVTLVTAALGATFLFVAAGPIASAYDDDDLVWPLRGVAVALFAEALLAVYLKAFIAVARIAINLRLVFLESVAESAATIVLVIAGAGAAGAAFGRAGGYGVGAALAAVAAVRAFGKVSLAVARRDRGAGRTRELVRYALPLLLIDGIFGLYGRVGVLIVGAMLSTTAVGIFSAPMRLLPPLGAVGQAASDSVAPRQAASETGPRVDALIAALRLLVILYAGLTVPLLVWADPIVSLLFGSDYSESADVLRALAPYVFLSGLAPLVSTTVNFLGRASRRIPIAVGALVTTVAIDIVFLPRIGVEAAAIGTSAAYLLYVPAHVEICRRELGFPLLPLLVSTLRAFLAAAAMGAVLYLAGGTETLSALTATLGLLGGIAAFAAVLVLTREISLAEFRHGGQALARLAARLRRPR